VDEAPVRNRRRAFAYLAVFAVGATVGAVGLVTGAGGLIKTSSGGGTPTYSVRPTGVGLPRIGAEGTVGAGDYVSELKGYHDSGAYAKDLRTVDRRARRYLLARVHALRNRPCRDTGGTAAAGKRACAAIKPALVLDIDETSLSNYRYISATNFSGVVGALALAVANADDPPIGPTLRLFEAARNHGVAVFLITGRPDNIPGVRSQTVANLKGAGYEGWAGLSLNPGGLDTVPYKSGERARIERRGYRIVANAGDQESDLQGGHADRAFKLPNPFYFIGP
jgi:HAD superfamily, subfamily IIIB (Acid phosphatase)